MSIIATHEVVNKHTQQTYRLIVQDPAGSGKYRWFNLKNGMLYGVKKVHPQLLLEHYKCVEAKDYYIRPIKPTDVDYYYKNEESDCTMTEEANEVKPKPLPEHMKLNKPELSDNEKAFKAIVDNMFKVYKAKNHDYGSSVQDTYEDYGDVSFLVRITDKLNRLKTLCKSDVEAKVTDEKIEDTILDLANYAILFKITRDASNK